MASAGMSRILTSASPLIEEPLIQFSAVVKLSVLPPPTPPVLRLMVPVPNDNVSSVKLPTTSIVAPRSSKLPVKTLPSVMVKVPASKIRVPLMVCAPSKLPPPSRRKRPPACTSIKVPGLLLKTMPELMFEVPPDVTRTSLKLLKVAPPTVCIALVVW